MIRKNPAPRACSYYGMIFSACIMPDATWIEAEEFCYPHGGMTRRAYAHCPDGNRRIVRCGMPETATSIPAVARIDGKYTRGYLTLDDETGVVFNEFVGK